MIRALLVAVAAALVAAGHASATRFAVGVDRSASLPRVAAKLRAYGPVTHDLARLHVLVVDTRSVRGAKRIDGVRWVEWLGSRSRRVAFTPTDPLASRQWYLDEDRAFDFWPDLPILPPVKVAVIDSGIDTTHPDLEDSIGLTKSFVGGSVADTLGHGTFVAGMIAAAMNNAEGIAGIALNSELLVGKVVRRDGSISLEGEAEAIRWAADEGARVINLSIGGLRDPNNPSRDTYSSLEAAAIDYAAAKGAVLVAAVGNSDQAPLSPWQFASYPAALPHVIGVSALARDGAVPLFSDRDPVYNDLAAPGQEILSTLPRALTRSNPSCADQGYSDCGPKDYRFAEGTSFAAPQVSAAAALLLAEHPKLRPNQVATILERSAADAGPSSGCFACGSGRDSLSGWGRLDIAAALEMPAKHVPQTDRYETNDDVGSYRARLAATRGKIAATLDYWDDPTDVYSVELPAGRRFSAALTTTADPAAYLRLWSPGTRTVFGVTNTRLAVARSQRAAGAQRLTYVVPRGHGGRYFLQARVASAGAAPYTLRWSKR